MTLNSARIRGHAKCDWIKFQYKTDALRKVYFFHKNNILLFVNCGMHYNCDRMSELLWKGERSWATQVIFTPSLH